MYIFHFSALRAGLRLDSTKRSTITTSMWVSIWAAGLAGILSELLARFSLSKMKSAARAGPSSLSTDSHQTKTIKYSDMAEWLRCCPYYRVTYAENRTVSEGVSPLNTPGSWEPVNGPYSDIGSQVSRQSGRPSPVSYTVVTWHLGASPSRHIIQNGWLWLGGLINQQLDGL